jgi:TatD DNase family protein
VVPGVDPTGPAPTAAAPPPRWIDSHCHLQDTYRPEGVELVSVLSEAAAGGVSGVVCVGTDAATSRQAVDLVRSVRAEVAAGGEGSALPQDFQVWATMGLHPHEASQGIGELEVALMAMLDVGDGTVVAVGECGLDYYYEHSPRPAQRDAFAAQVALARHHDLTLVVHSREAGMTRSTC